MALHLPFVGRWLIQNSPAARVPSHGTDVMGGSHAIDFVGVDERHRTSPIVDARTLLATEEPERFVAFGRPLSAPCDGTVVATHDGEHDHAARRSPLTLVPYLLGQGSRLRLGPHALAGNHITIATAQGMFVTLVHLRRGSVRVAVGDQIVASQEIAQCGNSGNSTQPHLHVQVTDSADFAVARGIPLAFRNYREWPRRRAEFIDRELGVPANGSVIEPLPR